MNEKTPGFLRLRVHPWGLLTAAGVVPCAATAFGFLGRFSWFLDLFSHFRVQYLIALSILGVLFLLGRRRRTAAVFIAFACINLGMVLPLYFDGQATTPEAAPILRAMLLNVNTRLGDAARVKQVIQELDPDILVLEEISSQWVLDLQWLANSYSHSRVQPREDNFGIGLFSKFPLVESEIVYIGDAQVPSIAATIDTGREKLRVIATHPLPPAGGQYSRWRNDQLNRLPDYVRSSLPLILLGDLNVTPWNYHFRRLLKRTGLIDSSKGRGIQPTWPNYNPLLLIPIDHCLHSSDISVLSKRIGVDVGSDHYPVIVDFAIKTEQDKNGPTNASTHTTEPAPVRGSS
jgi:endonuclease/exonuclease/phosphatase (EEP) superfamily protein YafD